MSASPKPAELPKRTLTDELSLLLSRLSDPQCADGTWKEFLQASPTYLRETVLAIARGASVQQRARLIELRQRVDELVLTAHITPDKAARSAICTELNSLVALCREVSAQPESSDPAAAYHDKPVQDQISKIRADLHTALSTDVSQLERPELDKLSFARAAASLLMFQYTLSRVEAAAIGRVSSTARSSLQNWVNVFLNDAEAVRKFTFAQDNAQRTHQQLVQAIREHTEQAMLELAPIVGHTRALGTLDEEAARAILDVGLLRQTMTTATSERLDHLNRLIAEAEKKLASVTDAVAKTLASKQAEFFKTEASKHASAARIWLALVVALGGLLVGGVVWLAQHMPDSEGSNGMIHYLAIRVVSISIVAYFLFFATRNYSANKHNEITNRHRDNALSVLAPLMNAVTSESAKDILLTRVADATFAHGATGYSSGSDKALAILNAPKIVTEATREK